MENTSLELKQYQVRCNYCGNDAELVTGEVIYPNLKELYNKRFWYCKPCKAYVGVHKDSSYYKPLGLLANAELRLWKKQVHNLFDPKWRKGKTTRKEAYAWLSDLLGIEPRKCHIGMFDVETCKVTVKKLQNEQSK